MENIENTHRKACSFTGNDKLNVTGNGIFGNSTFKPFLIEFIACCVYGHSSFKIIDTTQNKINMSF